LGLLFSQHEYSSARQAPHPARDGEWDDDAVAHRQRRAVDPGAHLDNLAHELVAEDVAVLHRRHVAVDQMQVRAANRR